MPNPKKSFGITLHANREHDPPFGRTAASVSGAVDGAGGKGIAENCDEPRRGDFVTAREPVAYPP